MKVKALHSITRMHLPARAEKRCYFLQAKRHVVHLFPALQVSDELEPPVLDAAVQAGEPYYVHGQSAQAQADSTAINHGIVSATELDANSQIRGDMLSGWRDSEGGVFQ